MGWFPWFGYHAHPSISQGYAKKVQETEVYYVEMGMITLYSQEIKGDVEGLEELWAKFEELFQGVNELPHPI